MGNWGEASERNLAPTHQNHFAHRNKYTVSRSHLQSAVLRPKNYYLHVMFYAGPKQDLREQEERFRELQRFPGCN